MPAVNPLRKPKPSRDERILHGRFYFTDEKGKLASGLGMHIYLAAEYLWITSELSIPVAAVESMQIIERRGLPPRRFLEICYVNPITGGREKVFLCKFDVLGIGLYRVRPLQDLIRRIEELRAALGSSTTVGVGVREVPREAPPLDCCEACGAKPAYYVGYMFLVSAILFSYRSDAKRRIHCRKHNAIHGLGYYLLTALTGWIGIGIFAYPFVVFAAGRNLAPALGKTSYVLGILPSVGVAALIVYWFL